MSSTAAPTDTDRARVREEVLSGQGLSLVAAAKLFPVGRRTKDKTDQNGPVRRGHPDGAPVNASTVWRWIIDGIRLADGRRLRLEGCRVSGRWLTSIPALSRFIDAQTPALNGETDKPAPRSPGRRQPASDAAAAELKRRGS